MFYLAGASGKQRKIFLVMSAIFYQEQGEGLPVVFLHGFCEDHTLWNDFQSNLSESFRVITLDLPGWGKSELVEENINLLDISKILQKFLLKINAFQGVMIGHSMGGYITLEFSKEYPDLLKGFGLFHSSAFADTEEKKANRSKTVKFIQDNGLEPFISTFVPGLFFNPENPELKAQIEKQKTIGKRCDPQTVIQYMNAMRDRGDSMDFLKSYDKPVLLIAGEADQSVPLEKSKRMAECLRKPSVHFLPETGHMGMFEKKEDTLEVVREFLSGFIS
jgi:pimeloyl-ACP methyl ester carboxylesterase